MMPPRSSTGCSAYRHEGPRSDRFGRARLRRVLRRAPDRPGRRGRCRCGPRVRGVRGYRASRCRNRGAVVGEAASATLRGSRRSDIGPTNRPELQAVGNPSRSGDTHRNGSPGLRPPSRATPRAGRAPVPLTLRLPRRAGTPVPPEAPLRQSVPRGPRGGRLAGGEKETQGAVTTKQSPRREGVEGFTYTSRGRGEEAWGLLMWSVTSRSRSPCRRGPRGTYPSRPYPERCLRPSRRGRSAGRPRRRRGSGHPAPRP